MREAICWKVALPLKMDLKRQRRNPSAVSLRFLTMKVEARASFDSCVKSDSERPEGLGSIKLLNMPSLRESRASQGKRGSLSG